MSHSLSTQATAPRLSLPGLQVFVLVVEQRSFSTAAKTLGLSTAAVSKRLRRLEEELGVALVRRTRPVLPTAEGLRALQPARCLLTDAEALTGLGSSSAQAASTPDHSALG
jgi:DNA-binding transcriptional LysR family regulator